MGERITSIQAISGKAVCSGCGGETFEVIIYNDSTHEAICINKDCRQIWTPIGKGRSSKSESNKAVVEGGDESGDVVSSPEGEVAYSKVASGIQGGYQAPEGGEKPKAPTTGSGVSDREAYNAFMREYMRKWREKQRKSQ